MKHTRSAAKIVAAVFLALLLFLTASNVLILKTPIKDFLTGKIPFSTFTQKMAGTYRDKLEQREWFLTLNGIYARVTGARVSNGVILLKNGMLTEVQEQVDTDYGARQITALSAYLRQRGTQFLYVQTPRKPDLQGALMPEGAVNFSNANADSMVASLRDAQVPLLDLRPWFTATPEQLERYFYKTDHHWTAEGAFAAFTLLAERIQQRFPQQEILSAPALQRENWTRHVKEAFFLGSHGRRAGIGFAGLDDLVWLTPNFETSLSCSIPERHIFRKGDFAQAALDNSYLTAQPDYYNTSPYNLHTGGDYAHVQFRNPTAPSDLRVLVMQDSFGIALEGMLSTLFQQVETVDLRMASDYTLLERIETFDPHIVIVLYNPSMLGNHAVFDFGLENTLPGPGALLASHEELLLAPQGHTDFLSVAEVEPGKTYTLTIEDIQLLGGDADCVTAAVFDTHTQWLGAYYTPDLEYIQAVDGQYRWVFNTPADAQGQLLLRLYAGLPGETDGVGAVFRKVTLREGRN